MTLELAGLCLGLVDGAPTGTKARLTRPDALVELSRQPSAIAHAVAHPLTTALMSLELSLERIHAADHLDAGFRAGLLEELASVAEGMERSTQYLRAMQDRARGEPARMERFDAAEVVRSCVVLERPLARRQGVTIQSAVAASEVFLRGDPNVLYQVLTHLVRNAVAASRDTKTPVVVGLGQAGQSFRMMVQDRGASLGSELGPDTFEPRSWTALGVARQLTEEVFGGRIEVDTTRAGSTTFAVVLPAPPQRMTRGG
jgi:signal transduction histidine kinase